MADSETNTWEVLETGTADAFWFLLTNGIYQAPIDVAWRLTPTSGGWEVTTDASNTYGFDANGLLTSIRDLLGNTVTIGYTTVGSARVVGSAVHNNGQALDFSYQGSRLTRAAVRSANYGVNLGYNGQGVLANATKTLQSGSLTTSYAYEYAANSATYCMTQKIDAVGATYTWRYEANGIGGHAPRCVRALVGTASLGASLEYDAVESNSTTVVYDRDGTDAVRLFRHDPMLRRVTQEIGPEGAGFSDWDYSGLRTLRHSDIWGNITETDVNDDYVGQWLTTRSRFDDRHNVTSQMTGFCADPADPWTYTWHSSWNVLTSVSDPEGRMTCFDYSNGLLTRTRIMYEGNNSYDTTYAYTGNGLLAAVTNANGHWVRYLYDTYGNPSSTIPQLGPTNSMTWDSLGHLRELRLPGHEMTTNESPTMVPRVTTFDPNELGWVRSITWPDSVVETFAYDPVGNLTNHVDRAGRTHAFSWLPTRKLASTTRYLTVGGNNQAATVAMDYDQQMNVVNVKDELDRTVESYQLDIEDRPVTVANVENLQMTLTWGVADYMSQMVRFDGTTLTFAYDGGGRLSQAGYPDDTVSYGWMKNGLLDWAVNSIGAMSNSYDGANRLVATRTVCGPVDKTVNYGLDAVGNTTNVVLAGTGYQVGRTFDAAERLSGLGSAGVGVTLSYDWANGLLAGLTLNNGMTGVYGYDKLDRLTNVVWRNASNQVLRSRSYGYTMAGMIQSVEAEDGGRIEYTCDSLDRLTSEKRLDGYGQVLSYETYAYDLAGNRIQKTILDASSNVQVTVNYTLGTGNRLDSWSVAETDLYGRVDVAGVSSEAIGTNDRFGWLYVSNLTSGTSVKPYTSGTNFWTYDLTVGLGTQKVVAAIRDHAGNTTRVTNSIFLTVVTNGAYQYSDAGCVTNIAYRGKDYAKTVSLDWSGQYQLTAVAIDAAGVGTVENYGYDALGKRAWTTSDGSTNWHVYDGPHVIADLDAAGGLVRSYVWGPGIDNLLAMTTYSATTNTYYAFKDHLNSVLALVNAAGQIVEQYRYDAWGRTTVFDANGNSLSASAVGNRYCWQGREYSFKTGLYYFRARWYDPVAGRWLSNDPIGISGGLNQYVMMGNNPVNFTDPFGLDPAETGFMGASQTMAGYMDGLLFGVLPNQDNANYRAGQTVGDVVSLAGGLARLGYAGGAKVTSLALREAPTVANAMKSVAIRNALKQWFRLNPWSEYRIYPYATISAKYGGDLLEIIKAAGRTNPYLNLLGGSMAGHGLYDLFGEEGDTSDGDGCK